jgi:hypothetical protein
MPWLQPRLSSTTTSAPSLPKTKSNLLLSGERVVSASPLNSFYRCCWPSATNTPWKRWNSCNRPRLNSSISKVLLKMWMCGGTVRAQSLISSANRSTTKRNSRKYAAKRETKIQNLTHWAASEFRREGNRGQLKDYGRKKYLSIKLSLGPRIRVITNLLSKWERRMIFVRSSKMIEISW